MGGFRLGYIFGIEIRIDYSWFIIFVLILWTLTVGVFPMEYPDLPASTYLWMGAAGTLLFFASLLAHELSHSLVARSKGLPADRITLFIFGGMAQTGSEFESPRDELHVAGIGPVTSFALAALFWLIHVGGVAMGWSPAVTGVAWYLYLINLILAIFNLFPGFPLDGGRLFRAAVWHRTGDLTRATRVAAGGGKIFGLLLIVFGVLNLFAANLIGGLWMIFIGWFVRMTADASYAQHLLTTALEDVSVGQAMTRDPETVSPEPSIERFVEEHLFQGQHQGYPVTENGTPLGIITLDRIRQVDRNRWKERTVREVMMPIEEIGVVEPRQKMSEVLTQFRERGRNRILVVEDGKLVGIVTRTDVARWLERIRMLEG